MVKSYKISTLGKIIAIAASIIMIILVTGKWLNLYQIPMIFGDSVQHKYSIFEITDFMDEFNIYLDNDDVKIVPSQQKWTQKSFKKRNESQYFVNLLKPTAFIPRFA